MSWRTSADSIIAQALATVPRGTPRDEVERIIKEAYPWGERAHWPYKAWLAARQSALAMRFAPKAKGPLFETIGERESRTEGICPECGEPWETCKLHVLLCESLNAAKAEATPPESPPAPKNGEET